jgi:hypothetical protein
MKRVKVEPYLTPPRIFGWGYKPQPPSTTTEVIRHARRTVGRARRTVRRRRTRIS